MSRLSIEELSILLLEPSLTQRKIIAAKLRAAGNDNVELVADPDAAWRSMCALTPDLVMSSMYFDKGTGSELLERMRASDDLNEVPFMLISSENRFEKLDPVKQAGVMAILPKPFSVDDMRMALEATAEYMTDEDDALFDGDGLKVLVVDDSVTARNHISRLLTNMGMENITLARDGLEAVKILEDNLFDIVITDFNMPEMDGERLTNYIRNHSSQSSIPILMVTSEENEARLDSVMKSGVSAICDKPFNATHVKNLLSQLLH
ncbi:MAG: two-component system chemotaxis response regulator CheY [Candidatus Azotimanducaceae bacterium]|jgi:two-component system chemotaxis response regulator CheY